MEEALVSVSDMLTEGVFGDLHRMSSGGGFVIIRKVFLWCVLDDVAGKRKDGELSIFPYCFFTHPFSVALDKTVPLTR